ncbi:hypothetical protein Dimus_025428 [Dionaea muscipula]
MQSSTGAGGNDLNRGGGGGAGGVGGLARFRSAPASWLEAFLDDEDPLKPSKAHGGLTQLLTAGTSTSTNTQTTAATNTTSSSNSNTHAAISSSYNIPSADPGFLDLSGGIHHTNNLSFHRQNSSPADFPSNHVDGYFSSFGVPASYDYLGSSSPDASASASASSDKRLREPDSVFISHLKGEQNGLLDLEMEKLLEDSVPCRVRAKRGYATHPRSIAERVRRTRISDRIRKLQELVPSMDKQTNTADMLEEAIEYVKRLQKQIKELTEQQKKCKCSTTDKD